MKYAEIEAGAIARFIEPAAPLPAHKLHAALLPVVDVPPILDAATQTRGAEIFTIEAARVVRTWAVVARIDEVPEMISRSQAKAALMMAGLAPAIETFIAAPETNPVARIFWEEEPNFWRASPGMIAFWALLPFNAGKSQAERDADLDAIFRAGAAIRF